VKRFSHATLLFLLASLLPLSCPAQEAGGANGLFEVTYPFTLNKGGSRITLGVVNDDFKTGDIDVNRFTLGFAYGLSERFELQASVGYNRVKHVDLMDVNGEYPYADHWQTGLGYAQVGAQFALVKSQAFGLSLSGRASLPLSQEEDGVTTAKPLLGVGLEAAHRTGRFILSANAGYTHAVSPDGITLPSHLRYGLGVEAHVAGPLSAGVQVVGKHYVSDDDLPQQDPVNLLAGIKLEKAGYYGISIAYKKNLPFNNKDLKDSHGAVGSVWIALGQPEPPPPPCNSVIGVDLKGPVEALTGETRDYQATINPAEATQPVSYVWSIPEGAELVSGQGTPTISIRWPRAMEAATVQVRVSNACSQAEASLQVTVADPVLPPPEEFYFGLDSFELTPSTCQDLDAVVKHFANHPEIGLILVEGHTCSIASIEYNLALGEHRAEAVKAYLVNHGISPDRIRTVSYGEEKPRYDNSTEESRRQNRRAFVPAQGTSEEK